MNEFQSKLVKLHLNLAHEVHGNFTKIDNIFNRTGVLNESKDKYFKYNLFLSLHMSGAINISWEETGLRWCVANEELDNEKLTDYSNPKLGKIYFKDQQISLNRESKNFIDLDKLIDFSEIVDSSVLKEALTILAGKDVEVYSTEDNLWKDETFSYEANSLVRLKDRFSGYRYYIFLENDRALYKVLEPEWMFMIYLYLSNQDYKLAFKYERNSLVIPASLRLPTVLYRYLYSKSRKIELGFEINFIGLDENDYEHFLSYLDPRRRV